MRNVVIIEAASTGRYYVSEVARRGLHPVVIFPKFDHDDNEYAVYRPKADAYCRQFTDDIFYAKTGGIEEYLDIAKRFRPIAVIAGSELGVEYADLLSERLCLPGNPSRSSRNRRDKFLMTRALENARVPAIRAQAVESEEECRAVLRAWNRYPIVLKPLDGAASQGVHFCDTEEDALEKFREILHAYNVFGSTNQAVLVQQFARGTEYIVNTVSRHGEHVLTDMWRYSKIPIGNLGNAYNYATLVRHPSEHEKKIIDYAFSVLTALDFKFGPSHTEIMDTPQDGPLLIETGARPMGGYFPPEVLERALGHYIVDLALSSYIDGYAFKLLQKRPYNPQGAVMLKLFISPDDRPVASCPILRLHRYLRSAGSYDFAAALEQKHLPKTVNLLTNAGELILEHPLEEVVMSDYEALRALEEHNFDLLFSRKAVPVAPMTFTLAGVEHSTGDIALWDDFIDFFGKLTESTPVGVTLCVTSPMQPTPQGFAALMKALGWSQNGQFFKRTL